MARWRPKNARRNREEWVGARVTLGNQDVLIWMSCPEDLVVHYEVVAADAGAECTLAHALVRAMQAPLVGEPRRPGRGRVATARDVREIRELVGTGMSLAQAPTPELDFLVEQMNDFRARGVPASWLDQVPELDVTGFFEAAALLFSVAPWKTLDEGCLVRVDSPEFGLDGAVVSVLGNTDHELGFLLFPSIEAHDAFLLGAERSMARGEPIDLGTSWLALSYADASVISPQFLADVRARGLRVTGRSSYPEPYSHGADGKPVALRADDVRTLEAVTSALALLFDEFGTEMFDEDDPDAAVNATFRGAGENGPSVELTAPYWAYDAEDWEDDDYDDYDDPDDPSACQLLHQVDKQLIAILCTYAVTRFGETWERDFARLSSRHPSELVRDFVAYRQEIEGKTLAAHFLEKFEDATPLQREWLDAQANSWLSTWEVLRVEAGVGLQLRDLLSGEERHVSEVTTTENLGEPLVMLGRVVEYHGISFLGAMHPRPLRPLDAARVVEAVRKRLGTKGDVTVEQLRANAITELLMDEWTSAVSELHAAASVPSLLQSTDGD